MNSSSARVTAAFLVRSPLTSTARSIRSGSRERLVAMYYSLQISLHNEQFGGQRGLYEAWQKAHAAKGPATESADYVKSRTDR
jgi:hypothetical protein